MSIAITSPWTQSAGVVALAVPPATVEVDGPALALVEQAGDPGASANQIKLYPKDVATVTQLFAQASDGTVTQLTPATGGTATVDILQIQSFS